MRPLRPIRRLLVGGALRTNDVLCRAEHLARLGQEVQRFLPPRVADHCRLANLRDGMLVLQVDSAAWATRLRYHVPALLKRLRRHRAFSEIRDIRIRVVPPDSGRKPPTVVKAGMSRYAAELLRSTADACDDPELGAALRRLASRGRED